MRKSNHDRGFAILSDCEGARSFHGIRRGEWGETAKILRCNKGLRQLLETRRWLRKLWVQIEHP
jgi:hypothetical protein